MIRARLRANPVPIQLPIGAEDAFEGVIDLIKMKAIYWDMETQGMKFEFREIPAALQGRRPRNTARKMIEAAAEGDDALTDKYLDGGALIGRRDQARPQGARAQERDRAVHVRHGVQEQGRAGAARRRHRIHAVAHRDAAHQGH